MIPSRSDLCEPYSANDVCRLGSFRFLLRSHPSMAIKHTTDHGNVESATKERVM